ncbi:hypothetical protein GIB67_006187 [Kingdonia uniflora]|uniref:RRM domain-containing protein n=1 Tax=Kingdonia uniflora TaxID=39325 RepID=A0A7J7LPW0_9MAGN|nr:hypothetical protein GIB67_006187 [Kingdonia uniflora]
MSVPVEQYDPMIAKSPHAKSPHAKSPQAKSPHTTVTSVWTINVSEIRTVKVANISLDASESDIKEFFSFSGDIHYVEIRRESERSQVAYVTFKDPQGADTALLLSGSTIVDLSITISPVENYELPPEAYSQNKEWKSSNPDSVVKKAEDVMSSMLAKGFVLGKDAVNKAKTFDERLHLISNATATVASLDKKIGLSEKISTGASVINEKVREVDEKFHVYDKTRSAFAAAEQKASSAGSAIMSNHFVSTGANWVSNAISMVAKAAEDVSVMTKEKVEKAEEEKKETIYRERTGVVNDFAHIHLDDSLASEPSFVPIDNSDEGKLGII